jgi:hypothetical protein
MNLNKKYIWGCELNSCGSGLGPAASSIENTAIQRWGMLLDHLVILCTDINTILLNLQAKRK